MTNRRRITEIIVSTIAVTKNNLAANEIAHEMREYKRSRRTTRRRIIAPSVSRRKTKRNKRKSIQSGSTEMKTPVLLLSLICVIVVAEEQKYTTKYDNVDVDAVVKNDRLLTNYVGCLLDRNPCSPDGAELRKNIPDALTNNCASCSEAQKVIADKLSHHLIDHRPDDWKLLEEKFDPSGAYRERYLNDKEDESK